MESRYSDRKTANICSMEHLRAIMFDLPNEDEAIDNACKHAEYIKPLGVILQLVRGGQCSGEKNIFSEVK